MDANGDLYATDGEVSLKDAARLRDYEEHLRDELAAERAREQLQRLTRNPGALAKVEIV